MIFAVVLELLKIESEKSIFLAHISILPLSEPNIPIIFSTLGY